MANRISYWLDVTGPSHNIDTACSSSNFAMTEAYKQILSGKCDAAIVASANLCLHPHTHLGFYTLGVYLLHLQYYGFILRSFQTCMEMIHFLKQRTSAIYLTSINIRKSGS